MSADLKLGTLVLNKYNQLNAILSDLILACEMGKCPEQDAILARVQTQTNHTGIHMTEDELAIMFLGRPLGEKVVNG